MPIRFSCNCGRSILAKDELAGRRVKCPQCGAVVLVPKPEPAAEKEEVGLLPLDDPWKEAPPSPEEPKAAPAEVEEISEVLPADEEDDEDEEKDDDEVSVRERVRRREEREKERAERREDEERRRRQRKRRREAEYQELVEKGRFGVRGSRGYFSGGGMATGILLIVVGAGITFLALLFGYIAFLGIALIVAGIIKVVRESHS